MLTPQQVDFFNDQGFLRIPQVFTPAEMDELDDNLDFLTQNWASEGKHWTGPWRKVYMDPVTEQKSKLIALHDLHLYSAAWCRAVTNPRLSQAMAALLGPNVELHHTTLHAKPPGTGQPFPMHQDSPFYQHSDGRYVDVLIHLDDTCHANGEIRFLAGSHKAGHLEHVTMTPEGGCTPHLPTDQYKLADTTPVPAQRGDVVCFNIYTIHGSYINTTRQVRRIVRVGYRDPQNVQIGGQSKGRPGIIVSGLRLKVGEEAALSTEVA